MPSSPAIDHGIATNAPSQDFEGNPRPVGSGYDIGAFEYQMDVGIWEREQNSKFPESAVLFQNHPNPFNPTTSIRYNLSEDNYIELQIIDILGREIRTLTADFRKAGYHDVIWDGLDNRGRHVPSGVYLYILKTDQICETKKLMMLK